MAVAQGDVGGQLPWLKAVRGDSSCCCGERERGWEELERPRAP